MFNKKLKKPVTAFLVALSILLTVFAVSSNLASASDGSISQANTYPKKTAPIWLLTISRINFRQLTLTRRFQ